MRILVLIFVIAVIFGFYQFYYKNTKSPTYDSNSVTSEIQNQDSEKVEISNYDECIEAGNLPLAEDNDKCLTKEGYLFIKGVE